MIFRVPLVLSRFSLPSKDCPSSVSQQITLPIANHRYCTIKPSLENSFCSFAIHGNATPSSFQLLTKKLFFHCWNTLGTMVKSCHANVRFCLLFSEQLQPQVCHNKEFLNCTKLGSHAGERRKPVELCHIGLDEPWDAVRCVIVMA